MTMSDEGIGDPMPRASEARHGEWRRRSRGSATRPSGSYQKGTVGMEASSDVLLVNVCVRRVDEAVANQLRGTGDHQHSGRKKRKKGTRLSACNPIGRAKCELSCV